MFYFDNINSNFKIFCNGLAEKQIQKLSFKLFNLLSIQYKL